MRALISAPTTPRHTKTTTPTQHTTNYHSLSDIAPEGATLDESNANLQKVVEVAQELQKGSSIRVLWGTAQLFKHPRYLHGAATSAFWLLLRCGCCCRCCCLRLVAASYRRGGGAPAPLLTKQHSTHTPKTGPNVSVFAYAAAQVKAAIDATVALNGENYVFWCVLVPPKQLRRGASAAIIITPPTARTPTPTHPHPHPDIEITPSPTLVMKKQTQTHTTNNKKRGGREGYSSLLNTDMGLELDNLAAFLKLAVDYKKRIGACVLGCFGVFGVL